jgi:hypothetical protein
MQERSPWPKAWASVALSFFSQALARRQGQGPLAQSPRGHYDALWFKQDKTLRDVWQITRQSFSNRTMR